MNRSKKLYILLGILLVACAATFGVMQMEEHKEQIKNREDIILELPIDSVQSLSWEYGETALAFHKGETWLYDEDEAFPVSEERIEELLGQFESFGVSFVIEDVEDFGQYGLRIRPAPLTSQQKISPIRSCWVIIAVWIPNGMFLLEMGMSI